MIRSARTLALTLGLVLVADVGAGGEDDKESSPPVTAPATQDDIKVGAIFDLSGATADAGRRSWAGHR